MAVEWQRVRNLNITVYWSKHEGAYCVNVPAALSSTTARQRLYRSTKKAADELAAKVTGEIRKNGTSGQVPTQSEQFLARELFDRVAGLQGDIRTIINDWAILQSQKSMAVWELCDDFMAHNMTASQGEERLSENYRKDLQSSMRHWSENFGNVRVNAIDSRSARKMLDFMGRTPAMWNYHRRHFSVLMTYAVELEVAQKNSFTVLKPKKTAPRTGSVLTPDQMFALLEVSRESKHSAWMVPNHAICGFSGCRPEEVFFWTGVPSRKTTSICPSLGRRRSPGGSCISSRT